MELNLITKITKKYNTKEGDLALPLLCKEEIPCKNFCPLGEACGEFFSCRLGIGSCN